MAKKAIDPDKLYRVKLTRSVQIGRSMVHPGPNVKLRGDVIQQLTDTDVNLIESYDPVG